MRARYIRTRAYIYERYEGPPRARASIWPVLRSTVIVAPDNVSGFVPPMDLPSPYKCAILYEGYRGAPLTSD